MRAYTPVTYPNVCGPHRANRGANINHAALHPSVRVYRGCFTHACIYVHARRMHLLFSFSSLIPFFASFVLSSTILFPLRRIVFRCRWFRCQSNARIDRLTTTSFVNSNTDDFRGCWRIEKRVCLLVTTVRLPSVLTSANFRYLPWRDTSVSTQPRVYPCTRLCTHARHGVPFAGVCLDGTCFSKQTDERAISVLFVFLAACFAFMIGRRSGKYTTRG